MTKKKMMRRRRTTIGIGVALVFALMMNLAYARKIEQQMMSVTVCCGDSVWSIAKANSSENSDVRKMVNKIIEVNNLKDATIHEGEELLIPIGNVK